MVDKSTKLFGVQALFWVLVTQEWALAPIYAAFTPKSTIFPIVPYSHIKLRDPIPKGILEHCILEYPRFPSEYISSP